MTTSSTLHPLGVSNKNSRICMARKNKTWGSNVQCTYIKKKDSDYCGRHKNKFNGVIAIPQVHKLPILITLSDYLQDSLLIKQSMGSVRHSCKRYGIKLTPKITSMQVRGILSHFFSTYMNCIINIDKLKKAQGLIKKWLLDSKLREQGPAINNITICNNETDFYSFDKLIDIDKKYIFSYKCSDGFIYGFHIESLIYLITDSPNATNPYTRQIIPRNVSDKAKKMWNKLKGDSTHIDLEESTDIKVRVRSKCITTFQKIDYFGYHTDINWLLSLSTSRLRMLFRSLASYWNYKAGFSQELKNRIYPHGVLFTDTEFLQANRITYKFTLMETIIDKIDKIVSSAENSHDCNTGSIMVLMGFSEVVRNCALVNSWLG